MKLLNQFPTFSTEVGEVSIRPLVSEEDLQTVVQWVSQEYAQFWGMNDKSSEQIIDFYQTLMASNTQVAYLGLVNEVPNFLVEVYEPESDPVGRCYKVETGDIGMHLLIAPSSNPLSGFSYAVMRSVLNLLFNGYEAKRIVVEPDAKNHKIHKLNTKVGFVHQKVAKLGEKKALLGFCTRSNFEQNEQVNQLLANAVQSCNAQVDKPSLAAAQLSHHTWKKANRALVKKMLCEFSHERLLSPIALDDVTFELITPCGQIRYQFIAKRMMLEHLQIDPFSIQKFKSNSAIELDALEFVLEFHETLGITAEMLGTYLEEISATLLSSCYKLEKKSYSAKELVEKGFQEIETSMSEGHPTFVANNGRIGFSTQDYHQYAPEAAKPFKLIWLAANRAKTEFSAIDGFDYDQLIGEQLDASLLLQFRQTMINLELDLDQYYLFPVHPWQWFNKLCHLYAADVAKQELVCLGYGDDHFLAQQSIRTLYNISHPDKYYVKTALSILNMGFMRGLSAKYMKVTPAINQWLFELVNNDAQLQKLGFTPLRELATLGYQADYYDRSALGDNPYKKMLAALWRENPVNQITSTQKLMTMAGLLHTDNQGNALVVEMIKASTLTPESWLRSYFQAYLTPLLHCFYQHKLVFMPHGENLILALENYVPVKVFMKDIGEEVCLLNVAPDLPQGVERIAIKMPEEMEILSIFTDVFDCIFRYLADLLDAQLAFHEGHFWQVVADVIIEYQQANPELQAEFDKHDLFAEEFALSCLNRLQLSNNKQMLDLTEPANSLQFAGHLKNPIARFRPE